MLLSTIVISTILSLTQAHPAPAPTPEKRWPNATHILKPTAISRYELFNGAITYNVARGEASKSPGNGGRDISTLVTFENTNEPMPALCTLNFWLDPADPFAFATGSKQLTIHKSNQPAPQAGSPGWGGPGNQRSGEVGRLRVDPTGGDAQVVQDYFPKSFDKVACPKPGQGPVGYEIVPVGDSDWVEWSAAMSGLYLTW